MDKHDEETDSRMNDEELRSQVWKPFQMFIFNWFIQGFRVSACYNVIALVGRIVPMITVHILSQ